MSNFDFSQFFTTFLFYLLWVLLVLLIWNYLWLSPYPTTLPHYNPDIEEEIPINNAYSALNYLYHVLFRNFHSTFWLKYCGFDALSYIYFLRRMFVLVMFYFLISFIFGIPYAIANSESELWTSFNLHDKLYYIYLQMFFLILFSLMFYATLYEINVFLFNAYQKFRNHAPGFYDLQLHTLRLKNLPKNYDVLDLRQKIHEILPKSSSDSLIQCVMIPESFDLLDKYALKKELNLIKSVTKDRNFKSSNCLVNCCRPYQNLDERLSDLEIEIEKMAAKEFKFSGNAFICLDSASSFHNLIEYFSLFNLGFWKKTCRSHKRHLLSHEDSLLSNEESIGILSSSIPSADDISWKNLNRESKMIWIKRLALNFVAVILMIFFTTPASLITVLGITDIMDNVLSSSTPEPGSFSNLIEKNISPMLIILVNQLLLFVIDMLAYKKRMIKVSATQMTIFNLCFIYMLINSFILPALSMTTAESIFSFLHTNNIEKVETLLKTFYLKDTGSLFIILLLQAGTFSFSFYLLRLSDLFLNFFDRKLVAEKREARLKWKNWLRDETENFQYGYFFANAVIYLIVVLVFSTTVPAVSMSGFFLFLLRLICDCYELISAHRKEMDSGGNLINKVIMCCCFGGIFFQVLILAYYSVNKLKYNVFIMAALIVGSGLFTLKMSKMGNFQERSHCGVNDIETDAVQLWEKAYRHPLLHKNEPVVK